ncbi:MAG: ammonia-forming cytochrome c nitrite reductase subunit c552 [Caldilineales bacterium]|nr:ammonia-forming cytochrome c nitrite reductase subunit c552 [Caldilineales bacterium]
MRKALFSRQTLLYLAVALAAALLTAVIASVLVTMNVRKQEAAQFPLRVVAVAADELDPAVWGQNFPRQYDTFRRTEENYGQTPYGGSDPYSKLERNPALVRLWAGYAFSVDHNEERGHFYAQIDQANTQRVKIVSQPGACANCHAAETPGLIAQMGWEAFNRTPYNDLADQLHTGSSCADCHDPETMALRITRPAFLNAMQARGIDVSQATRQEMRSYVCAQCHVEYYFLGENKLLTFPWTQGLKIENIEAYYDALGFKDWTHAESGAPMLKVQHPEFEMWSSGLHARSGVACADCHMPYMRDGSVKISDHWLRSPLVNLESACQTCHKIPVEDLQARVLTIQNTTADLLHRTEQALLSAIDAIVAARAAGAGDEDLAAALQAHRGASLRWDFVSSENSTGFHSPQEAARILAEAIDLARQAELHAVQAQAAAQGRQARAGD